MEPKIEDLDAALKLMAPIISHEIRNPMAVIGNSSYFIKTKLSRSGDTDPKVTKHLGIIESEIKHANDVLGEMLAYARMRDPAPQPQDLNTLVGAALDNLPVPEHVTLKKSLSKSVPKVLADNTLVPQALRHVIRNAVEALLAPDPGIVRIKTGGDGKFGVVEVSDTGPGIPEKVRDRLFTPFTTEKPRGTGLGLAFAAKVMRLHKGRVETVPIDKGTCFKIFLPAA
ncbi:PAS domain-containing sensor histidine kinase [Elusimicrobiota bacterium]